MTDPNAYRVRGLDGRDRWHPTAESAIAAAEQIEAEWAAIGRRVSIAVYYRDGSRVARPEPSA